MAEPRYQHILRAVLETPWAIDQRKWQLISELLAFRAAGHRYTLEEIRERVGEPRAAARTPAPAGATQVAVLPVVGTITQRADMFTEFSGGATTERIAAQFREFVRDPSVRAIVLDIDSPGGSVYGVQELAAEIAEARGSKPIVAVANSLAASGAYWIATAAEELVVTPSGEVGSIGVFAAHQDISQALEAEGIKLTLIKAGKFKAEGNPWQPLSEEAQAYMQERVNDYYRAFTSAVAKYRGVGVADVREGFGQGRVVGADAAVRMGMADRVGTLDETIGRLLPRGARGAAKAEDEGVVIAAQAMEEAPAAPAVPTLAQLTPALTARLKEALSG